MKYLVLLTVLSASTYAVAMDEVMAQALTALMMDGIRKDVVDLDEQYAGLIGDHLPEIIQMEESSFQGEQGDALACTLWNKIQEKKSEQILTKLFQDLQVQLPEELVKPLMGPSESFVHLKGKEWVKQLCLFQRRIQQRITRQAQVS